MARNVLTLEQANARIHSQMPLAEKMARADVVSRQF
jgi:dephospho-CoA kinase